ncbi:hypothetical protein [Levilactobacillus spicheri]|uniref:TPM domain-containing protein n=2 Tax=Levilactobacillus spicheri TaxID=216463 RepID=A0ABQ0WVD7_9LACO|nr:hypothetical protein [Levilactobacillus spicheri]KRL50655.1 hypothetical protein FD37_GL001778 [Levilactobacillus spicheri DSM 15429]GEO66816.1 hypothetical protein LSP04_12350 [Levilactobacillus spicheri]
MRKGFVWRIIGGILFGLSSLTGAAAAPVVHDGAHLLTPQQRTTIETTNQNWTTTRQRPQLWVYTYARLSDSALSGFDYDQPFYTPGNDLVDRLFTRIAEEESGVTDPSDWAVTSRVNRLHHRVSVIMVFPDHGWHTVITPSDDLLGSMSDLEQWWITQRLPNQQGTGRSAMTFFNRYSRFVGHHVANAKTIKPGMSADLLSFLILLPFMLWGLIHFIRNFHNITFSSGPYDDYGAWNAYWFGRWMGGDHSHHGGPWS